ncbi:hypothetical protein CO044_01245 [Candidatus Peregrinibacteria bacterium CG_4_9_14_0_2_um_filter_38_9]|nr:MAG: hypothetical protein CO044_01245 [Candidatus Peregrinibacteria bacterium CG_4_9_14_0_2_um_filter_38_9]
MLYRYKIEVSLLAAYMGVQSIIFSSAVTQVMVAENRNSFIYFAVYVIVDFDLCGLSSNISCGRVRLQARYGKRTIYNYILGGSFFMLFE